MRTPRPPVSSARPAATRLLALLLPLAMPALAAAEAWIRVNQVGYLPHDPKIAILSSDSPLSGRFRVGDFEADIGPDAGAWGPFAHNYRLDFTPLRTPGRYTLQAAGAESPPIRIGEDVYTAPAAALLEFMRLQRCGRNPVTHEPCHQHDALDSETGQPCDLIGGWHDAADRIKHMITTTYCVAALLLAGEPAEGRYGAELVRRIHPDPATLYVQVGDDRDHGLPHTLWHADQTDYGHGPGGPRPAWRALGRPQGPRYENRSSGLASLAGRTAAALALAGDLERARSAYELARANPGCAMSVPVKAPYHYMESDFYDDLEWGAIELYIATREPRYLREALEYADQAGPSPWLGHTAAPTQALLVTPAGAGSQPATSQSTAAPGPAATSQRTASPPAAAPPAVSQPAASPPATSPTPPAPAAASQAAAGVLPARHGHYEWFPYVNLAHWRLYPHADSAAQARIAGYYRSALERAARLAEQNPYRLATPLVWCSTNDVIALATQAVLYERMTGDARFRPLAAECRDWIFGRNPWGVSFVIGVPADGDAASRPHHLFWLLKQHLPVGGVVDGPVYKDINDGLKFAPFGHDRLARFQSDIGVYHDAFEDFSTNEPIIDGTVSLRLLLAVWDEPAPR